MKQAAFTHPTFPNLILFFSGNQYVIVDAQAQDRNKTILFGPRYIAQDWPSLVKAGFDSGIDAVLPNPKDTTTAYVFSDGRYALVKVVPPGGPQLSTLIDGPYSLTNWKALKEVDFKTVDAVLPNRGNWAYIFSGDCYINAEVDPNGTYHSWHYISGYWDSLKTQGFTQDLGTITSVPGTAGNDAYFFKGDKYAHVTNIVVGMYPKIEHNRKKFTPCLGHAGGDKIVGGDTPKDVATDWPALKEAQFFW